MRVTITHNKPVNELRQNIDRGFDDIFKGLPIAAVQFTNQQRSWNGQQMDFSFTAQAGFLNVPIKGFLLIEEKLLTIDIDLPSFLSNFLPEEKVKAAIESQVKGLLT